MTWPRRKRLGGGGGRIVAAVLAALSCGACARPPELLPGVAVEGRLEPGQSASYRIEAGAAEYLRVAVEPTGRKVRGGLDARVADPRGAVLLETRGIRNLADDAVDGVLAWISAGGGRHRVVIEAPAAPEGIGYHLILEERRPSRAGDADRVAAQNARTEALGHYTLGEIEAARAALERELDHWRRVEGSAEEQAEALLDLAEIELRADPDRALARCEEAIQISAAAELGLWRMTALNAKGRLLARRDCAGAFDAYREAREIALGAGALEFAGNVSYNLGRLFDHCGSQEQAAASFGEAIDLGRRAGKPGVEAVGHRELAVLARRALDLEAERDHLSRASKLLEATDDIEATADVLHQLAVQARSLGRLAEARDLYRRSLDLNEAAGRGTRIVEGLVELGTLALELRLPEEARRYFSVALEKATALGAPAEIAAAQRELGAVEEQAGEPDRAVELYRRSLATAGSLDPGPLRTRRAAAAKFRLGNALLVGGREDEAIAPLNEAVVLHREIGDLRGEAMARGALGTALARGGDPGAAVDELARALALDREAGDPVAIAWTLHRQAAVLAGSDPDRARDLVEEAIETIERVRSGLDVDPLRAHFFEGPRRLYELYVDLLIADGDARRAFSVSERGRARALLDLLAEAQVDLRQGVDPRLREEARRIEERMLWLRDELAGLAGAAATERAGVLQERLAEAEQDWWRVEAAIRKASPAYQRLQAPAIVGVDGLQVGLPPRRAVLEYWLGRENAHVFVVTRDHFSVVSLGPTRDLLPRVDELRAAIVGRLPPAPLAESAHGLYRELVEPALAPAGDVDELIVIADGPLHLIPFEALVASPPSSPRGFQDLDFLVRRMAISYAPSATILANLEADRAGGSSAATASEAAPRWVAFADPATDRQPFLDCGERGLRASDDAGSTVRSRPLDPLSGALDEVHAIAAGYGDRARVFVRDRATESRVKQDPAVAAAERLHFAVHGVACETFPERSGLVLAASEDPAEDGFLQTREIFGLRLAADLVVLSACDSGTGKLLSGEGVLGLARAFFHAGTPTTLVSLWPVSDRSTADLMKIFYSRLDSGDDKAVALQRAQRSLIDSGGRHSAPFYWAPFVLLGSREVRARQ